MRKGKLKNVVIDPEKNDEEKLKRMITALGIPDRTYRDHVFRMLLNEKERALEVYNAMNNSHYDNPDELEYTTLENAVYIGMKNDVSFLVDKSLALYEHQSTINPNMPLRDLLYVACIYSGRLDHSRFYGETKMDLPMPQFVVFYNGKRKIPEHYVMKLSDSFKGNKGSCEPALELKVEVYDINHGKNKSLMEKSSTLREYAIFVDTVRRYADLYGFGEEAMTMAINECIENNVLKDFLIKNKQDVLFSCLFEYDAEKHMDVVANEEYAKGLEDGKAKGLEEGEARGRAEGQAKLNMYVLLSDKLIKENRFDDLKHANEDETYRNKLYKEFGIN